MIRGFKYDQKNGMSMMFSDYYNIRTQDLPDYYFDAAQFYMGTKKSWQNEKKIFNKNASPYILNYNSFVDIDDITDWEKAKNLKTKLIANNENKK